MEADYARIESDLSHQAVERANIETECDLIERISFLFQNALFLEHSKCNLHLSYQYIYFLALKLSSLLIKN
jgi:hypothetical protein